jgi:hypothetical protein
MIAKVGILPTGNKRHVASAYKNFTRVDDVGFRDSFTFKQNLSIPVVIEFIGLWYDRLEIISRRSSLCILG